MIQLTKASSSEEIKAYFNAVLKLAKASEKYPVNLDEVWMLIYERKDSAVKALVRDFVENEDYKLLRRKVEQVSGAKYIDDYYLTVSCLEYFIVKKVRPVFEVYRKVFHKSVEYVKKLKEPTVKDKIAAAKFLSSFLNLNESSRLLIAKSIADPLGLPTPDYTPSKGIRKQYKKFADMKNISIFAVLYNLKGGEVRKTMWAIFMSARKHIRFQAPVSMVNATTAFEVYSNGSAWNRSFISAQRFNKQTF